MTPSANLIGDFSAIHGLAEASRRVAEALLHAGVDLSISEVESGAIRDEGRRLASLAEVPEGRNHPVDLVLLNVNEMKNLKETLPDHYTIGLWYWELLELEPAHLTQYQRVDEVWVASDLVKYTFKALGDKPVRVFPAVVPAIVTSPMSEDLNLPDGLRVLFTFDARSSVARKNPFGCVEAFKRAFTESERGATAHLIVKVQCGDRYAGLNDEIRRAVEDVNGTLIDTDLERSQMDALLDACDIYLSLHRSEGFGLGMAEAMSLGKAVIATAFGGNTSYMTPETAALVGFRMRKITAEDHILQPTYNKVYRPGRWWAEPDVDQAARWLRLLADDAELRTSFGQRAARHIVEVAGPEAVGKTMADRLVEIDRERQAD